MEFKVDAYTAKPAGQDWYGEHEAHTARGWVQLTDHLERFGDYASYAIGNGYHTVGNWLDYAGTGEQGRDGNLVHAVAYYQTYSRTGGVSTISLGSQWFETCDEARGWIMRRVSEHCGEPMLAELPVDAIADGE